MTEPLRKYRSSDVPEFSSYPAEPDRVTTEVMEFNVVSEYDALPESSPDSMPHAYEEPARKVGSALGRLVRSINSAFASMRDGLNEQYKKVEDDVTLARETAGQTYDDATRKVQRVAKQGLFEARTKAVALRRRAGETVEEYPLQTLAAVGVAGVAIGIGLRAWRNSRG